MVSEVTNITAEQLVGPRGAKSIDFSTLRLNPPVEKTVSDYIRHQEKGTIFQQLLGLKPSKNNVVLGTSSDEVPADITVTSAPATRADHNTRFDQILQGAKGLLKIDTVDAAPGQPYASKAQRSNENSGIRK
jgi:hypothetical protein